MTREEELEVAKRIALERLGIVEELRWPIVMLLGFFLQCRFDILWLSFLVPVLLFFVIVKPWDRAYIAASDAYERETGTGKYWIPPPGTNEREE
jgi:hypothetical protein